jgi:hypothetical protein
MLRDVTVKEARHFEAMEPVTADELLDMHEFLRGFDGDFRTIFDK